MRASGAGGNEMKKARKKILLGWPLPDSLPASFHAEIRNEGSSLAARHPSYHSHSISVPLESANTSLSRLRGLMFRKKPVSILFTFAWPDLHGIHSFFVSFPFDAVYLDEAGRVVDVFVRVPPFIPYLAPRKPVRYLIELPPGMSERLHLEPNDSVNLYQCP